jgi:glycosyltransferase involved in cell wall biosynthesis
VRLSVILPCRNAAAFLPDAIASLAAQTFTAFEVVAVDDGSTDATARLLADWAARDARVRVFGTPGIGVVGALRYGVRSARGELIARMDADDVAHPERLAAQLALLDARPDIAACGTQVRYFPAAAVRDGARRYAAWLNALVEPDALARDVFVECPIAHPTLCVRASALAAAGGYRDCDWPEDHDLVLRIWAAGGRLANVPRVLLDWREHGRRLSRIDARYSNAAFHRCRAHHLVRTLVRGRPLLIAGAGPVGKAFARAAVAEGAALAAFVEVDPRKVGQTIHGARVVSVADMPAFAGAFGVAAVSGAAARATVRAQFVAAGWREMQDFCAVA